MAISALVTAYSIDQQKSAQKKQQQAQQVQRNQQSVENRQARASAMRENRIRKSRILAMGEGMGIGESSGVTGAIATMDTKLGSAFAQQTTQANTADTMTNLNQQAAMNIFNSDMAQGINQVVQSGIENFKVASS